MASLPHVAYVASTGAGGGGTHRCLLEEALNVHNDEAAAREMLAYSPMRFL